MISSRPLVLPVALLLFLAVVTGVMWSARASANVLEPVEGARRVPWELEWGRGESIEALEVQLDRIRVERRERMEIERATPIRAVYMPWGLTGHPGEVERFINLVERTELNAIVIDVKADSGDTIYPSQVPLAREAGVRPHVRDLKAFAQQFTDRGIKIIARIVVYKDSRIPLIRPEWAVQNPDGTPWQDSIRSMWVDPHQRDMWEYVVDISIEAARAGFWEIQYDYVRFPTDGNVRAAVFPHADGSHKQEVIRDFLAYASERLEPYEVVVSADVFGLVPTFSDDMGIGQHWETLAEILDVLSPMAYPSHYGRGNYGLEDPNSQPYLTVFYTMSDALRRAAPDTVITRPWLQAFSWGHPYGPQEVRAQIRAVYDAGAEGWMLWNAMGRYNEAALLPAEPSQ